MSFAVALNKENKPQAPNFGTVADVDWNEWFQSSTERHLVVGLLECPYHQKGKAKDFFPYFTDAYPLAKSISLQGLRLVLKPTKLLEPYFIVFTCSWRPSWHINMVPLEVLGRWPLNLNCVQLWPKGLWSTCCKCYMAAREMSHQYLSGNEAAKKFCETNAVL